ncbi:MAG: hypothetical protein HC835_17335 [Oscillatoriales cyanobacterium RM2_1_1]|nr:hypothetical protein [Oscillatoriales cyanobacterium SM2_3_0]NJO47232.1 hypothetical protein [Oscillatoriales cyanobacterium RM2_1_1]
MFWTFIRYGSLTPLIVLTILSCEFSLKTQITPTSALAQENTRVVGIKNKAYVLRQGDQTKEQLKQGTELADGDKVIRPRNAEVVILCGNGVRWYVESGEHQVGENCSKAPRTGVEPR